MKLLVTLATIASLSISALADHDWSACKTEIEMFAKGVKGDEAIYQALLKHDDKLSKTCDAAHEKYEKLTGKKK